MKVIEFLKELPSGAPVCCFGARIATAGLLDWAKFCGAEISSQDRLVVSGGACGLDSAFVKSLSADRYRLFLPDYARLGKSACFARSRSALEFTKSLNGGAIVVLSNKAFESKSGGSYYSLTYALKLNIPVMRVLFDDNGLSFKNFIPQLELF